MVASQDTPKRVRKAKAEKAMMDRQPTFGFGLNELDDMKADLVKAAEADRAAEFAAVPPPATAEADRAGSAKKVAVPWTPLPRGLVAQDAVLLSVAVSMFAVVVTSSTRSPTSGLTIFASLLVTGAALVGSSSVKRLPVWLSHWLAPPPPTQGNEAYSWLHVPLTNATVGIREANKLANSCQAREKALESTTCATGLASPCAPCPRHCAHSWLRALRRRCARRGSRSSSTCSRSAPTQACSPRASPVA